MTIVRRRLRYLGLGISSCMYSPSSGRSGRQHARVRRCLHPFVQLCVCIECIGCVVIRGRNHRRQLRLAIWERGRVARRAFTKCVKLLRSTVPGHVALATSYRGRLLMHIRDAKPVMSYEPSP